MLHRRKLCLITLGALAIFIGGTVLAARRTRLLTGGVSATRHNEKARPILGLKPSQFPAAVTPLSFGTPPQDSDDPKPGRPQLTDYPYTQGETGCYEDTPA